jgi:vancomycin permeability regulator SanA
MKLQSKQLFSKALPTLDTLWKVAAHSLAAGLAVDVCLGRETGFLLTSLFVQIPMGHFLASGWLLLLAMVVALGTRTEALGGNSRWSRAWLVVQILVVTTAACVSLGNGLEFYQLARLGNIQTNWWIPSSGLLFGYLLFHIIMVIRNATKSIKEEKAVHLDHPSPWFRWLRRSQWLLSGLVVVAVWQASLVFHVVAFGQTDYRRAGDVILVLGAKVYADGTLSEALQERVDTGITLYKQGYAHQMVMSGGVDPNGQSEAQAMKKWAVNHGVPASAVVVDDTGFNTKASIETTKGLADKYQWKRVLTVSHFFHLTRIKMLCAQQQLACFTVPADEGDTLLLGTPFYVLRETVALLYYYPNWKQS